MEDSELAILDWLHTFEAGSSCTELAQLRDGVILAEILHEIVPDFFEVDQYNKNVQDNWAIGAGNLRMLLKSINEYFTTVLQKRIDTSTINVSEIAKTGSLEDVVELLQLVVGVAVLCENKAVFISNIFQLNHTSQAYLKAMVEQVLSHTDDLDAGDVPGREDDSNEDDVRNVSGSEIDREILEGGEEVHRLRDDVEHLTNERNKLMHEKEVLEKRTYQLLAELDAERQRHVNKPSGTPGTPGGQSQHYDQIDALNARLTRDVDDLKLQLDSKVIENQNLHAQIKQYVFKLQASSELMTRLEMENQKYLDELEVSKERIATLATLESQLDKYKNKLESFNSLKQMNKELNTKLDSYLDKIHDLESTNKSLLSQQKNTEGYRNKNVELEREKYEMMSTNAILEESLRQQTAELQALRLDRQRCRDELQALTTQLQELQQQQQQHAAGGTPARYRTQSGDAIPDARTGGGEGGVNVSFEEDENPAQQVLRLKEQVRRLQHQLARAGEGEGQGSSDQAAMVESLREELEAAQNAKAAREESLRDAQRQLHALRQEKERWTQQRQEAEAAAGAAAGEASAQMTESLRELQQKVQISTHTIGLLENKLKEKEAAINKLDQEKNKLEAYTRRSLSTFKEKYMSVLQTLKSEKVALEEKLTLHQEKLKKINAIYAKEERVMSSALFEIGVKIMDINISSQLMDAQGTGMGGSGAGASGGSGGGGGMASSTFLAVQREALRAHTQEFALRSPPIRTVQAVHNNNLSAIASPGTPVIK